MPLICIQCSMKALVEGRKYEGEAEETVEEHMARVHPDPDPVETQRERTELERKLRLIYESER